jgi:hypothetical protein
MRRHIGNCDCGTEVYERVIPQSGGEAEIEALRCECGKLICTNCEELRNRSQCEACEQLAKLKLLNTIEAEEPPCTCECSGDVSYAWECELHNPESSYNHTIAELERELKCAWVRVTVPGHQCKPASRQQYEFTFEEVA